MTTFRSKKNIANSKAMLISIGIHALILLIAGNLVALRFYKKYREGIKFEGTERPKLELRKLEMPVKIRSISSGSEKQCLFDDAQVSASRLHISIICHDGSSGSSAATFW